jgi:hypothetical protein
MPLRGESFWDRWTKALEDRCTEEGLRRSRSDLRHHQALDYVLMLLRHHRPGFDDLPREERTNLVADACAHMNEFLETLRKLLTFLELSLSGWVTSIPYPFRFKMAKVEL